MPWPCSFSNRSFSSYLQDIINPKSLELGSCFERMFTPRHVSHVICQVSRVTCQVSGVMCQVSSVRCQIIKKKKKMKKWWSSSVEGLLSTGPTPSSFLRYPQESTHLPDPSFSKIAITLEPVMRYGCSSRFRISYEIVT